MTVVPVADVVIDEAIYPRLSVNAETVADYAEALDAGAEFPPIRLERGTNRLLDGRHRLEAHQRAGATEIAAEFDDIPPGEDPRLFCASLSSRHGERIPNKRMRALVEEILRANPEYDPAALQRRSGLSPRTIARIREPFVAERKQREATERRTRVLRSHMLTAAGWTQRRAADALGVSQQTVTNDCQMAVGSNGQPFAEIERELLAAVEGHFPPPDGDTWRAIARRVSGRAAAEDEEAAQERASQTAKTLVAMGHVVRDPRRAAREFVDYRDGIDAAARQIVTKSYVLDLAHAFEEFAHHMES